jgi:hypothetical protein
MPVRHSRENIRRLHRRRSARHRGGCAVHAQGRESKAQFGESLGRTRRTAKTLGSSIMFQARKHDRPMPYTAPPWVRRFTADDFKLRPYGQSGFDLGLEYGYWWIEWGGCLDTLKDNEAHPR